MILGVTRESAKGTIAGTVVFTGPTTGSSIAFEGKISNLDSTNKVSHFVSLNVGGAFLFRDVEVPYGSTLATLKFVIGQGESVIFYSDVDNTAEISLAVKS